MNITRIKKILDIISHCVTAIKQIVEKIIPKQFLKYLENNIDDNTFAPAFERGCGCKYLTILFVRKFHKYLEQERKS